MADGKAKKMWALPGAQLTAPASLLMHGGKAIDLPWEKLRDGMVAAGWLDLNNQRGQLTAGGLDIAFGGVHDAHIDRERYEQVAGPADSAAALRVAVMHSPEPRLLDQFTADGY